MSVLWCQQIFVFVSITADAYVQLQLTFGVGCKMTDIENPNQVEPDRLISNGEVFPNQLLNITNGMIVKTNHVNLTIQNENQKLIWDHDISAARNILYKGLCDALKMPMAPTSTKSATTSSAEKSILRTKTKSTSAGSSPNGDWMNAIIIDQIPESF